MQEQGTGEGADRCRAEHGAHDVADHPRALELVANLGEVDSAERVDGPVQIGVEREVQTGGHSDDEHVEHEAGDAPAQGGAVALRNNTVETTVNTSAAVKQSGNTGFGLNRCIVTTNVRSSALSRFGITATEKVKISPATSTIAADRGTEHESGGSVTGNVTSGRLG